MNRIRPAPRTSARHLPPADYRRWVIGGTAIAAAGYALVSAIGISQYGFANGGLLDGGTIAQVAAAAVCFIGLFLAFRGFSTVAAWITLVTCWTEVYHGLFVSQHFPESGLLATPAIIAAACLLLGPRTSFVLALLSAVLTPVLLRSSPALRDTGFSSDAIYWLTIHGVITLALWALVSLSLRSLGQVLHEVMDKERELADTIRSAPDGILVVGADDRVLSTNPAAERLLGVDAGRWSGRPIRDLLSELGVTIDDGFSVEDAEAPAAPTAWTLAGAVDTSTHVEVRWRRMQGNRRQLVLHDVTERVHVEQARRSLEQEVAHARRMEAIAGLAGGLAHDFNNLLTTVGVSAELLREELAGDPRAKAVCAPLFDEILAAQERGASLTQQLLAFARRDAIEPRLIDMGQQVVALRPLLQRVAGDPVVVSCDVEPECRVRVDIGQIERALVHLVTNAREAMAAGGRCAIAVRRAKDDAGREWVHLRVTDEGTGMDAATAERAFEPFFTTKPRGRGTGLGLASVHGIVSQSDGRARIESVAGKGTTVALEFPFVDQPLAVTPRVRRRAEDRARGGAILVAEDDNGIRVMVDRILRRAGYTVLVAPDGAQALQLLETHPEPIDLLLTDVMMPGLTGPQLAMRAHALQPDLPIIFMSGYPQDALAEMPALDVERDFIPKPFSAAALTKRVSAALTGGEPTAPEAVPAGPVPSRRRSDTQR
ncbi:MAG: ATP-binding protein [Gemmatimonadales bacterium]